MRHELSEKEQMARSMVCLPLDGLKLEDAKKMITGLSDYVGLFKINDAFTAYGSTMLELIAGNDSECFIDMKFHDIPNTVKNHAYQATTEHEASIINVHASGGFEMMKAAKDGVNEAIDEAAKEGFELKKPKILAVTVLTSYDLPRLLDAYRPLLGQDMQDINFRKFYNMDKLEKESKKRELNADEKALLDEWDSVMKSHDGYFKEVIPKMVLHLAKMADDAGLDGIVCSVAELGYVRQNMRKDFICLTPGIKSPITGKAGADQKRTDTPSGAVTNGANIIVVGRAITGDPKENLTIEQMQDNAYAVVQDIASVL
jgi:orotidine-5'-phosphate decarboxylase